jgi:hypothetical protein
LLASRQRRQPCRPTITIEGMAVHLTHWGAFEAVSDGERLTEVRPWRGDPEPMPLIGNVASAQHHPARITTPGDDGDPPGFKLSRSGYNSHMGAEQDLLRAAAVTGPNAGKPGELGRLGQERRAGDRDRIVLGTTYLLMGVLLAGYVTFLAIRGASGDSKLATGWGPAGFELVAGALCIARGVTRRPRRAVALTLGLAITSWALGDLVLAIESQRGVTPPTPSLKDVFYLGFYPLAYVAAVIFIRGDTRRLTTPSWLDGAVASVGIASVCAAFVFSRVLQLTGTDPVATATNLAYPIGDVLLLSLIMGGSTVMPGRRKAPWVLMAAGMAINAVGDTANLFGTSFGASRLGFVFNAIAWPASLLVLSVSVWLRPRPADLQAVQEPASFVIPGMGAVCALAVLLVGNLHGTSRLSLGLATAALLLAGVRLAMSVRGIRSLSQERRRQWAKGSCQCEKPAAAVEAAGSGRDAFANPRERV